MLSRVSVRKIALPKIASQAKSLKVLQRRGAARRPGDNVIDMEFDSGHHSGRGSTLTAPKRVPTHHEESQAQRGVSWSITGFVSSNAKSGRLTLPLALILDN